MSAKVFYPFRRPDPFAEARAGMERVERGITGLDDIARAMEALNVAILREDAVAILLRALGKEKGRAEFYALRTTEPDWRHSFTCAAAEIEEALKAAAERLSRARGIEDRLDGPTTGGAA